MVVMTERHERAYHRATLPVGKGGLGLLKSSVSAATLWWSNLRNIQADPTIYQFLTGLDPLIPDALLYISDNVGGMGSQAWLDLAPLFLTEVSGDAPEPPPKSLLRYLTPMVFFS